MRHLVPKQRLNPRIHGNNISPITLGSLSFLGMSKSNLTNCVYVGQEAENMHCLWPVVLWVWNSLWTQSHDKIPESALCIRLAYLEKNPFVLIDEWILPLFGVNSVTSVKSHLTQYLKLTLSLKLCAFQQTGWKPAWICGVRCSSDPS